MRGHSPKLTRKQNMAIAALLVEPTYQRAAAKVGIGESSLYRWLKLSAFKAAYRAARRQALEGTIATLQRLAANAVIALAKNMSCGNPGAENRAAMAILDYSLRGEEVIDQEERLAQLEEFLKTKREQQKTARA